MSSVASLVLLGWCRLRSVARRARFRVGCWWSVVGVAHQGPSLSGRAGSAARHLFAPEGMARSGHDPRGLNQLVDVATEVGFMPITSSLGVVSEPSRCDRVFA